VRLGNVVLSSTQLLTTYDGDGNRVRKSNGNLAANGTLYWSMTPGVVAETDLAGTLKSDMCFSMVNAWPAATAPPEQVASSITSLTT
jgi:hypothetical protein